MPTIFPTWPHILFAVLEPLSMIGGFVSAIFDLEGFVSGQTPSAPPPPTPFHPSTVAVTYQLGNIYLLLMFVGVGVMYSTSEPRVLRNYLIALAIADAGHICATGVAMGWDAFVDVGAWGAVAWGNIGLTAFLFANRLAYLLGMFGYAKAPKNEKTA
ncbi:hypothetical protein VTN77DRAFT_2168 [Rasamsonia byssochlamydoides]|uniref:uncharacterized protein n=1 Tax=Rasamsonia byssochlamydoides TaxID=89139 RepID=UPI003742C242